MFSPDCVTGRLMHYDSPARQDERDKRSHFKRSKNTEPFTVVSIWLLVIRLAPPRQNNLCCQRQIWTG